MELFVVAFFFLFNDTATTEIYTLSLHDALSICPLVCVRRSRASRNHRVLWPLVLRSEEHTSELQSPCNLVCRLLLEKQNHPGSVEAACAGHGPLLARACATPPT